MYLVIELKIQYFNLFFIQIENMQSFNSVKIEHEVNKIAEVY